jgi:hypothetical protein
VIKFSRALKISEYDICKGEPMQNEAMKPFEFVRKVSILMQEFIEDEEGFLKMLAKVSDHPFELFDIEAKQEEQALASFTKRIIMEQIGLNSDEEYIKEQIAK